MSEFINDDGSGLVGGQLPSGVGQSLQLDNSGNLKVTSTGGSGGGPVTAVSGAFVSNAIVDLFTLLTLAGTSGDANTVASFMGRFTKIRDLLAATLTVQGTITEANSAAMLADLATLAGAVSAGKVLTTEANSAAILADLATLAGAITAAIMQSNVAQIAGTATAVNAGTINAGTQRVVQGTAATGTKSNVASNAGSVTILAANTSRKGATIYNDSTQILYLDLSGGTASNSAYSVQVGAQAFFELPGPTIYNGLITGIWAAANGNARVTEFS